MGRSFLKGFHATVSADCLQYFEIFLNLNRQLQMEASATKGSIAQAQAALLRS
jgi:hypothetical protein